MKQLCFILALAFVFCAEAQKQLKLTGQKNVLTVQDLTVNPDGSVTYTLDGKKKLTAGKNMYDYAWIPMPAEISEADVLLRKQDFAKAEPAYQAAYEKYNLLGWGVYCISHRAEALAGMEKLKEAAAFLDQLKDFQSMNPVVERHLLNAKILYSEILLKLNRLKEAGAIADTLILSKDDSAVFSAFLLKGDIAGKQGEKKKAVRCYLQAAYLFPEQKERPRAFYQAIILLKEMKDPRWKNLETTLKKRYPDSEYSRKLNERSN